MRHNTVAHFWRIDGRWLPALGNPQFYPRSVSEVPEKNVEWT